MISNEVLALARQYKKALIDAKIPFTSMMLFGSAARGNMRQHSDIDIAVIGTPFGKDRMEELHALWRLRRPVSYKIQPLWFYQRHLDDRYSSLAQEIRKDGVPIA